MKALAVALVAASILILCFALYLTTQHENFIPGPIVGLGVLAGVAGINILGALHFRQVAREEGQRTAQRTAEAVGVAMAHVLDERRHDWV